MTHDEILLQLFNVRVSNMFVGKFAESGRQPVDHRAASAFFIHNGAGALNHPSRIVRNANRQVFTCNKRDLTQSQVRSVKKNHEKIPRVSN